MPNLPLRYCAHPGCRNTIGARQGYCATHRGQAERLMRRSNVLSVKRDFYETWRWRQVRRLFLQEHPLCVHCQRDGRTEAATEVDHVIPHRGDERLFWDDANWQALCKPCHSRKTLAETGRD